jgi:hypothetical protein
LYDYWTGIGVDTAVVELKFGQCKLFLLPFLFNENMAMALFRLLCGNSATSDAIQDGSLPQQISSKGLLLRPHGDLGAPSVDDIGSWV